MAIDEAKFKKLKRAAEEARQARDRAAGQLEAAMDRLKDEFGCDTVEEAQDLAKLLDAQAAEAEAAYDEAVEAFEEEWSEHLED